LVKIYEGFLSIDKFLKMECTGCTRLMKYTTDEKSNIDQKDNQRLPSYFLTITKFGSVFGVS